MDPLVELPQEKWRELLHLYKQRLPEAVAGFSLLEYQIMYPKLQEFIKVNVYCPFGDMENGFIAVIVCANYQISIQPLGSVDNIEKALSQTNMIDWNQNIMIPSASPKVIECLKRIQETLGVKVSYDEEEAAVRHILKCETPLFDVSSPPANTYVSGLKPEHIKLVDETWTYHGVTSHHFFEVLMKCGLTWVLYSTAAEHHRPVAWVTVNNIGALTHLYCLEDHRRKGYAEYILKVATNDLLKRGLTVLAYTVQDNVKPQSLFKKLGFENIGPNYWVFVNKI